MASNPSQASGPAESQEVSESNALNQVLDINRMTSIRGQIGIIADASFREGLISEEVYEGYRELAEGREKHEMGAEMLENTRKFAEDHEKKAIRIHQKIQAAISKKIASKADEEFLMEKLVIDNVKFTSQADEIEGLIDEKLDRMNKDKENYDVLANHDLIKDIGYLKVDGNTRIEFPNEEEFLKLSVPERRALMKELEEALPKAEAHAKEREKKEDIGLVAGYTKKLDAARKEGIIGEHTYKEFLNCFTKIDYDDKKYWNEEFEPQMKRYRTLWTQVRSVLQGEALKEMEGMIDGSGYTELFTQFGKLKQSESKRLNASYAVELEKYREAGTIGQHTMAQFALWMNQQELFDKYDVEEKLPDQMLRYEELWQKTVELSEKQQEFMRSKIDIWGYTELNEQYERFSNGEGVEGVEEDDTDWSSLNQIRSHEAKNAIVETDEMLASQGGGKRRTFIEVLDKMFRNVSRDRFNASSFEGSIRTKVANDNDTDNISKSREANADVNVSQIKEDTNLLEDAGAKVIKQIGFTQVESKDKSGKRGRETQVTMNEEEGMKRLFTEEGKHGYRSNESGGHDNLSLAIKTSSGRTVELDLQEIHSLRDHLKKKELEELDKAA